MKRTASAAVMTTVALLAANIARAGTYEVVSCAGSPDGTNHSWTATTSQPAYAVVATSCPPSGPYSGLAAYDNLSAPGFAPGATRAVWDFESPTGSRIVALRYSRYLGKDGDNDWQVFAKTAEGLTFDTCSIPLSDLSCSTGQAGYAAGTERVVSGLDTSGLSFGFSCQPTAGASTCAVGVNIHSVWAMLYSATVTLSDPSAPSLSGVGGSLFDPGYVRGDRGVVFDASDNAGVRVGRVYVDGSVVSSSTYPCDFTYTVPCSDKPAAPLSIDSRSLSDGSHTVRAAAADPAGNEGLSSPRTITVDNHAPASPDGLSVDGGSGWRDSNSFAVSWVNPGGQVAPISTAHYQLCSLETSSCYVEQQVSGSSISHLDGVSVPTKGEWTLRVWLEDAAGNVDSSRWSGTTLRFGTAPTTEPSTAASGATEPTVPVTPDESPTDTTTTTPPPLGTSFPRAAPALRLTSARYTHGRLIIRGRTAKAAAGPLALRLRVGRHTVRTSRHIRGGAFRITIPLQAPPSPKLLVTFRGTMSFRAQSLTTRIR